MSDNLPEAIAPREDDYALIEAAVMETERGRWFLTEYARRNRHADTEVLMHALERIEKGMSTPKVEPSVDTIRFEINDLADAITRAKQEVAQIRSEGKSGDRFGEAVTELDAIVAHTEQATGEILEAAEKIQEIAWTLRENGAPGSFCDILDDQATQIYTACSFQDITGQRTQKVVNVVGYLERRINKLVEVLTCPSEPEHTQEPQSAENDDPLKAHKVHNDTRSDADLLNGPASVDEMGDQDSIDALFDESETISQDDLDAMFETAVDVNFAEEEEAHIAANAPDDITFDAITLEPEAEAAPTTDAEIVEDADIDAALQSFDSFDPEIEALVGDFDLPALDETAHAVIDEAALDAEMVELDEEEDLLADLDETSRRALFG